jgi:hypothetical protein
MNEANPEQLISALTELPVTESTPAARIDCDICGEPVTMSDDDETFVGKGVFLSVRGDEVRYEDAPLCSTCATAIGINALIRAEIEEDEG